MIRKAILSDREKYIEMVEKFYSTDAVIEKKPISFYENTFDFLINDDTYGDIFIFESNSDIIGYALTAKTFSQEAGGMCLWLEEIYIEEAFRKKGIGSSFLDFIKKEYENDYKRFRLEVELENTGAVKLYKNKGFDFFPYKQMIKE